VPDSVAHRRTDQGARTSTYSHVVSSNERVATGLVPELDVSDLAVSLDFYRGLVGFTLVFERPGERFAYLDLEGSSLMLQEAAGPGRRFRTGLLERPFGRGVNFQTVVADVDALFRRVIAAGFELIIPLEERWYEVDVLVPTDNGASAARWRPATGSSSSPTRTATSGGSTPTSALAPGGDRSGPHVSAPGTFAQRSKRTLRKCLVGDPWCGGWDSNPQVPKDSEV
jgi:catechol 2,3-dioxygenase-like lactoylglutathione lyase family enzyme